MNLQSWEDYSNHTKDNSEPFSVPPVGATLAIMVCNFIIVLYYLLQLLLDLFTAVMFQLGPAGIQPLRL